MTRTPAILTLLVSAMACATPESSSTAGRYREALPDQITASLFPGDAELLSDSQIREILKASPELPRPASIALVHLQHDSAARFWGYGPYWSVLLPGTRQELATELANSLYEAGAVSKASPLPTFLLPEKPSVAHLREASARFRTDAVLIYRSDCQAYERYRMFRAPEAKAFCSVEAALLDARTGIVPYTAQALHEFTVKKAKSDANMVETVRRGETEALEAALREVGKTIGSRMNSPE